MRKPVRAAGVARADGVGRRSGGAAPFDRVGCGLVGRDLLDAGAAVAVPRQPKLGRLAAFGEMEKLGIVTDFLKDADRAERRMLGDLEAKIVVEREGARHRDDDDAAVAEVALVQRE